MICFDIRKGLAIHKYWQAANTYTIRLCTLLTGNYNVSCDTVAPGAQSIRTHANTHASECN